MADDYLTLTGIRPREKAIGPPGNHLRWAFPEHLGFPQDGFAVFRRPSGDFKASKCLDLTKENVPAHQLLASGSSLDGISFDYAGSVRIEGNGKNLSVVPPSTGLLELSFAKRLACLQITMGGIQGTVQLKGYSGTHCVAISNELSEDDGSLQIVAPNITRATIKLNFKTLAKICHVAMEAACKAQGWGDPIKRPLIRSADEAITRLEEKLQNRYAPDWQSAVDRYKPELKALVKWLALLRDPTAADFIDPDVSPDQLQLPSPPEAKSPLLSLRPQAMLLLAALDPNIARFLSLYWVDEASARGVSYDYKVEGYWKDRKVGCGLLFGLGSEEAGLPIVDEPLEGNQLPGLRWQGKDWLGRVGLRWPRPKEEQGPVRPVLFDLWRDPGTRDAEFLTKDLPVLVPTEAWKEPVSAWFVDAKASLGKHHYKLRGIDLFGQVGKTIASEPIMVEDLEAPPPPIRVRARLTQQGYPWRTREDPDRSNEPATLTLQFEYGDAQHRQAPDATVFRVYWRAESTFESKGVAVQSVSTPALEDDLKVHTVRVQRRAELDEGELDLNRFLGGKLSRESSTDAPLPATERHHYQIAQRLASDRVRLAPSENEFANGSYRLISDPRLRTNWTRLDFIIPVRPPMHGALQSTGPFPAKASRVKTLTPRRNPLAIMPASHRPAQLDESPAIVEVELDRKFLETNLFAGGTLQVGGASHPILYSTSGSDQPSRLGLPPGTTITGNSLLLSAAQPFEGNIRQMERLPGNGLAITLPPRHNPAGTAHLLGGLVTIKEHKHNILQAQEDSAGLRLELRPIDPLPASWVSWTDQVVYVTPPIVQALTIQGKLDGLTKVPGGELAFNVTQEGQLVTFTARVVSTVQTSANTYDLLVRLSPAAQAALKIGAHLRYYEPYQQELKVKLPRSVGDTAPAKTLVLPMSPGQASQSIYLAVTTSDERKIDVREPSSVEVKNEGPLSAPVQVIAIKPPPSGACSRPYPCGYGVAADAGYATPPDRQGRATLCLAWTMGDLDPSEGLRFEVARASDSGILATHRRNWLLGGPSLGIASSVTGPLSVIPFDQGRGLHRVALTVDLDGIEPSAFRGGRLSQNGRYFQVTTVKLEDDGKLQLMLRPMKQDAPTIGTATLETPPNYDAVRDDVAAIAQLAVTNPDAFGLVTGVPIPQATDPVGAPLEETCFRDEIPGLGRSRFFYRVRAVDAAENRSAWSAVSVAFYQVDTSVPQAPSSISVTSGIRSATLRWPIDLSVDLYAIHRARSRAELVSVTGREPLAIIGAAGDEEAPLEVVFPDGPIDPLNSGEMYLYRVVALRSVRTGPNDIDRVVVSSAPSEVVQATPVDPDPPVAPDDLSAERVLEAEASVIRLEWSTRAQIQFLVRRRLENSSIWTDISAWRDGAESSDSPLGWRYEFADEGPVPDRTVYQVVLRNHAGRTALSNETNPT